MKQEKKEKQEEQEKQKVIVIIDAYKFSKDFVTAAKSQGYSCLHVYSNLANDFMPKSSTYDPNDYLESYVYSEDAADLERWLKRFNVIAVIPGTDLGVELAAMINELCDCQLNVYDLALARRDKLRMLEACASQGVDVPRYLEVDTLESVLAWLKEYQIEYPVVVKPRAQAGSVGVFIVHDLVQLVIVIDSLQKTNGKFTGQPISIIVEEFLTGVEFVVNTISCQGKHYVTDYWRYHKVETGSGSICYERTEMLTDAFDEQAILQDYAFQCLDAVGIRFGASHTEIMMTSAGPRLVEVNARVTGGYDRTIWMRCVGYDLISFCVESYLQATLTMPKPHDDFKKEHVVVFMLKNDKNGIIAALPDAAVIKSLSSYYKHSFNYTQGEIIAPTTDMMNAPGKVTLIHADRAVLEADYAFLKSYCAEALHVSQKA